MRREKFLGQHFLTSREPIAEIIQEAKKSPAVDFALEIGPGRGALTRSLAAYFPEVVAVEKDRRLAEDLKKHLPAEGIRNCAIIAADILKTDIGKMAEGKRYAVIANIPYYLTSRLIRALLETDAPPSYMILMVQEEVAERMAASPPRMNLLALAVRAYGARVDIIGRVSREKFSPIPRVDSAIVKISGISKDFFEKSRISEKDFFRIARAAFSQKRKMLVNSLTPLFSSKKNAEEKIKKAGISPRARPEELSLADWVRLLHQYP